MNKTLSMAVLSATVLLAAHRIPIREGNQVWGTTTVYVGPYTWSPNHEPMSRYNKASTVMETRYDFPNVTCNAASDIGTATCPQTWACESHTGSNLPDGTEVKFGTTGTLPTVEVVVRGQISILLCSRLNNNHVPPCRYAGRVRNRHYNRRLWHAWDVVCWLHPRDRASRRLQ